MAVVAVVLGAVVVTLLLGAAQVVARGSGGGGDGDRRHGRSDRVDEPEDARNATEPPAAQATPVAVRSFTMLLILLAAVLVFLRVHGRLDRRDPKRPDLPGEFRRFR